MQTLPAGHYLVELRRAAPTRLASATRPWLCKRPLHSRLKGCPQALQLATDRNNVSTNRRIRRESCRDQGQLAVSNREFGGRPRELLRAFGCCDQVALAADEVVVATQLAALAGRAARQVVERTFARVAARA